MRTLTALEIDLASRPGIRKIAVERFLTSMDLIERYACDVLDADTRDYNWNYETASAISAGIKLVCHTPEVGIDVFVYAWLDEGVDD